jgi:hypothetical protein
MRTSYRTILSGLWVIHEADFTKAAGCAMPGVQRRPQSDSMELPRLRRAIGRTIRRAGGAEAGEKWTSDDWRNRQLNYEV